MSASEQAAAGARAAGARDHRDRPRQARRASATSGSRWPTAPAARRRQALIEGLLVPAFAPPRPAPLAALADAGAVVADGVALALTTDSFVVKPLRFPGGSIGELAVNGTVNDLAVGGARPLALSVSMILEEGLEAERAARRGRGDRRRRGARPGSRSSPATRRSSSAAPPTGCTCAPTGHRRASTRAPRVAADAIAPGDQVLVSGPIGEHGTAIMLARGEFDLDADDRVGHLLAVAGRRRAARRRRRASCTACATRPAAASPRCSTSWRAPPASRSLVREADVPVAPVVAAAAELLGIDPMYIANEGRLVAFVAPEAADRGARRAAGGAAAASRRR